MGRHGSDQNTAAMHVNKNKPTRYSAGKYEKFCQILGNKKIDAS